MQKLFFILLFPSVCFSSDSQKNKSNPLAPSYYLAYNRAFNTLPKAIVGNAYIDNKEEIVNYLVQKYSLDLESCKKIVNKTNKDEDANESSDDLSSLVLSLSSEDKVAAKAVMKAMSILSIIDRRYDVLDYIAPILKALE